MDSAPPPNVEKSIRFRDNSNTAVPVVVHFFGGFEDPEKSYKISDLESESKIKSISNQRFSRRWLNHPSEKYLSNWIIAPSRGVHIK